jgi:hypothetical protein
MEREANKYLKSIQVGLEGVSKLLEAYVRSSEENDKLMKEIAELKKKKK